MERLRRKSDLDRAFREGRRFHSPWAVLQARRRGPGEEVAPEVRLAVVAGRRFSTAVARNRAKRLLRETCRVLLGRTRAPWDLLLVARPEVLESSFSQRVQGLGELLREAGVLAEEATAAA